MHKTHILQKVAARLTTSRTDELRFAARAWLLAPIVEGCLALFGLQRTLRLSAMARRIARGASRETPHTRLSVEEGRAWVDRAYAVHWVRGACLPRAVVQFTLHAHDGTASRLVIGVRRLDVSDAALGAHAWVAPPGTDEPPMEGFRPIWIEDALPGEPG